MARNHIVKLTTLLACLAAPVFGNIQETLGDVSHQIEWIQKELSSIGNESSKATQIRIKVLKTNLDQLEKTLSKKLKHAEEHLFKYQDQLRDCKDSEEIARLLQKIETTEKKIRDASELLTTIEKLHTQFDN